LKKINHQDIKCVYCGKKANTQDHIPSKGFFKGSENNPSPILVPSCYKCNSEKLSKDEEYFRNLITSFGHRISPEATRIFLGPVKRSITKSRGLAIETFRKMKLVDCYDSDGNYQGKKTKIHITPEDWRRILNVLDKYIKGLFFHHFNRRIPSDWVIKHLWLKCGNNEEILKDLIWGMRKKVIIPKIFGYGYNVVPNGYQSVWCLVFFDHPLFFSFVMDKDTARISN